MDVYQDNRDTWLFVTTFAATLAFATVSFEIAVLKLQRLLTGGSRGDKARFWVFAEREVTSRAVG
jgi:hypothetical protein